MSGRQRKASTFPDMVRTVVVFAVIIGAFVAFLPKHKQVAVKPVDYASDLSIFSHAAAYEPLVPTPLPTGWVVTSFRGVSTRDGKTPDTLHMGIVTARRHYAAIEETNGDAGQWVTQQTKDAPVTGSLVVGGVTWERREVKGVISLTRTASGFTTVLTGGAPLDELQDLIGALAPAPK